MFKNPYAFLCSFLMLLNFGANPLQAQNETSPKKFKINGNFGLSQDFFFYSTNDTLFRPTRPNSLTRLNGGLILSYGKFSLPFSLSYTIQDKGSLAYNTPIPKTFNIKDLLNSYNRISLSPTIGKLQFLIGTQVPSYSPLTSGDLPVFGAGIDWKPKRFRLAAFYGMSQRGVNSDSLLKLPGSYQRMSMGAKVGLGEDEVSHFHLIALRHTEDLSSAKIYTPGVRAQENLVFAVDQKILLFKKFFLQSEVALSSFSPDISDPSLESDSLSLNLPQEFKDLFTPRFTSNYGAAATGSIGYNGTVWGIRATGKVITPEYRSLNIPFLQSDLKEWLFEPRISLFKGNFNLNGSLGQRSDNLMNNKLTTSTQTLGSANLNMQLNSWWSVNAMYGNYGLRNSYTNDTFRVQNVASNLLISNQFTFNRTKFIHSILVSGSTDKFQDFNIVSGRLSDNETMSFVANYNLQLKTLPMAFNSMASTFQNKMSMGTVRNTIAALGVNYAFGKKTKVNTGLQFQYMYTSLINLTPDQNFTTSLILGCMPVKKLNLGLTSNMNLYKYGTQKPGVNYRDNSIRLYCNYAF